MLEERGLKLKRKMIAGIMLTLLILSMLTLAFNIQLVKMEPATIIVPDDYSTIQEAINAAGLGETIFVRAGTYHEHVVVGKSIQLIGEDPATTIIDGSGTGNVIDVEYTDNVNITGFTIQNGQDGITLYSTNYDTISNNIILNHTNGITFRESSSCHNLIVNCSLTNVSSFGILLWAGCNNNTYENCNASYCGTGFHVGWGHYNLVKNCKAWNCSSVGILLDSCQYATVESCDVWFNGWGIRIQSWGTARYNTIIDCDVFLNKRGIHATEPQSPGGYNKIYHNNLVNNTQYQAQDDQYYPNEWDNGYPSGGNYWSNYNGTDIYSGPYQNETGSDGMGDTPYNITGTANTQDNYPLMEPWPPAIKIGVIGPMAWLQGQGIKEGAILAAEEINATGGILGHPVKIITADTLRGQPIPNATTGIAAAEELIAAGVDFAIGGFNNESAFGAREVFMNHSCIYFITGASTDRLVDCGNKYDPDGLGPTPPGPCNACVRCDYERYKYLFRVFPVNGTTVAKALWAFHRFVLEDKLLDVYGVNGKVKVAVVSENLPWADALHWYMTTPGVYNNTAVLGPYANVTYSARLPWNGTDFSAYLAAINASGARLIIHSFSEEAGRIFISQWGDMEVEAVPVGINVHSQESNMWDLTGGNCEYATILAPWGTKTPITNLSIPFWNAYVERWGHDPIYISHAPYNSIYALKETIEAYGSWPIDPDTMVPLIEQTDRTGLLGKFRYTGPWNATHKGIYHDVFCNEIGANWTQGYARPFMVQWKAGEMEVIWPADQPYSKELRIPPWMCIKVPQNYSTIQEAINAAPSGFTICVSSGTYNEAVVVNKTLTLIGENRSNTIIDGSGLNYTGISLVTITADDVDMSGFTVTNAQHRGIQVENSRYCEVHDTIVCFTGDRGIFFNRGGNNKAYDNVVHNTSAYGAIEAYTSNNNTIYNNLAYFNQWGIFTSNGSYNLIYNNTVTSNSEWGIVLSWYSTGNTIIGNNVTSNSQGGIITVYYSNNNTVSGNEVTLNGITGISASNYSCYNTISGNTVTSNGQYGIALPYNSSGNTVSNNTVTSNEDTGIILAHGSSGNTISGNTVTSNAMWGIFLFNHSGGNNITGNTLNSNGRTGIVTFLECHDNIIMGNRAWNNSGGISLRISGGNTLRDNNMTGNQFGFSVWSDLNRVSDYVQDIDTSNIVDGKPIYYWVNQSDKKVPADAGHVHAVNCFNITVEDLNLTKNGVGVRFVNTTDSTIRNVTALDNAIGINLILSSDNIISGNTITSLGWYRPWQDMFWGPPGWMPGYGIALGNSSGNTISGNTVTNNDYGIILGNSSGNTMSGNVITNGDLGVGLEDSSGNTIYHNNFINNTVQANVTSGYVNTWDDDYPSGGNYWNDYDGTDLYHGLYQNETGSDGRGDTQYVISENNTDRYPLVKPYGIQHDIGITNIATSKTVIGQGYSLHINIRIVNYGINAETFNVTAYANTTILIDTQLVTLARGNSTTVTFTWNTAGVPYGNYTISAEAGPVPGETDTADNAYVDGLVLVAVAGDVNVDGIVDIYDGVPVAAALGAKLITDPQDPRFGEYWHEDACSRCPHNPLADINQDGVIDGLDLEIVDNNYGKTW